jgi:hypothetical protein
MTYNFDYPNRIVQMGRKLVLVKFLLATAFHSSSLLHFFSATKKRRRCYLEPLFFADGMQQIY